MKNVWLKISPLFPPLSIVQKRILKELHAQFKRQILKWSVQVMDIIVYCKCIMQYTREDIVKVPFQVRSISSHLVWIWPVPQTPVELITDTESHGINIISWNGSHRHSFVSRLLGNNSITPKVLLLSLWGRRERERRRKKWVKQEIKD